MKVMKDISYEKRPDYLRNMFENYFKYAKYNHYKIPFELLIDAIGGGLSGANFPEVNRTELLKSLIENCKLIEEAAKQALEYRQPVSVREAKEPAPTKDISRKVFLNLDEVCSLYGLHRSNIKDKAWRDEHNFPYLQTGYRGSVTYKTSEVEKWIVQQQKH